MIKEYCEELYIPYKLIRNIIISIALILVTSIVFSITAYTVPENHAAVVKRMGEIVKVVETPGLHFKMPIIHSVDTYPKSLQYLDVSKSEVLTRDKKSYVVDTYDVWRITDIQTFVRVAKTISSAEQQLNAAVYGASKTILGQHNQNSLIGVGYDTGRDVVNKEITEEANKLIASLGIESVGVEIKALDVPPENENAIYERMISERNQSAATYRAEGELIKSQLVNEADKQIAEIKANAEMQAEVLKGEAEAEYMRIWAEAYNTPEKLEFYEFVRSLEALEKSLSGKEPKTLILSGDSKLAQIISGK